MKIIPFFLCVPLIALIGCSKGEENAGGTNTDSKDSQAVAASDNSPSAQKGAIPTVEIRQAVQQGQYDRAVDVLAQSRPVGPQVTDAQRLRYQQAMQEAAAALLAKQNDPAAKAAYDRLARSATGR